MTKVRALHLVPQDDEFVQLLDIPINNHSKALQDFRAARDLLIVNRLNYEEAMATFRWPTPAPFNWALDHFDDIALRNSHLALWIVESSGAEVKRTFEEMRTTSNRAANYLLDLGIGHGDRLLVMLPNRVELWEVMLAAIKLGAVISPATTMLSVADLQDRIDRGEMSAVIVDEAFREKFEGIANGCKRIVVGGASAGWSDYSLSASASELFEPQGATQADDPCLLYFTSGTTSKPKMVLHTHRSYPVGHLSTLYWLGLQSDDIHLNISSPGWAKHAYSSFFVPWTIGATVFIYNQARFDAAKTLETLVRCGVTTLCAPPTAWRALILEDLSKFPVKLREVVSAGEPLNPEVIEQVKRAWDCIVREAYGQTETTAVLGNPPGQPVRYGSMGRPLPGYQLELLDPDGRPSSEGEVSVALSPKPAGLMARYWGDADRTNKALGGNYYGTSDIASRDADGYFWFVGRTDDVFKSSDYRISPFELESALLEHAAVAEAAVVESPDSKRLFVPKACIVLKPGFGPDRATAKSIFEFSCSRLAPYQKIRIIEFCDLPKTVSGKIRRSELRSTEAKCRASGRKGTTEFFECDLSGE